MPTTSQTLTLKQARRIALAAQGFLPQAGGIKRYGIKRHGPQHFDKVLERIGVLQLDSVNVLDRAHYLTLHARLGGYDKAKADACFHDLVGDQKRYFEYWGHEASLIPVSLYPALRWRMERAANFQGVWRGIARVGREKKELVEAVFNEIAERGPLAVRELETNETRKGDWWGWSDSKIALEFLFWSGRITSAGRVGFHRYYDIPERVIPRDILDQPALDEAEAHRVLMEAGARCHGVGTEKDFRDYFRLDAKTAKLAMAELIEEGILEPVSIDGWNSPTYLHRDAVVPTRANCQTLLAPFDSLIWHRDRTKQLFGCHYRIEIYVPKEKRQFGYYVLPYLQGDQITARIDLKANRQDRKLEVRAAHLEAGAKAEKVLGQLGPELIAMAEWQGLDAVVLTSDAKGDLVPELRQALQNLG